MNFGDPGKIAAGVSPGVGAIAAERLTASKGGPVYTARWCVQVLNFNTGINFGAKGNLKDFDPVGFSATPDDVSTWSASSCAEVKFRLPPLRHDVRFAIEVFPFLADGLIQQQGCFVFFNGLFVYYHSIRTPVEMSFNVPRDLLTPRGNRLSFALPNAISPNKLKLGDDLRLLGLSFVKLAAGPPAA